MMVADVYGRAFESAPGEWHLWEFVCPPRDAGPVLCRREGRWAGQAPFTVDPGNVDPMFNIGDLYWQVPRDIAPSGVTEGEAP